MTTTDKTVAVAHITPPDPVRYRMGSSLRESARQAALEMIRRSDEALAAMDADCVRCLATRAVGECCSSHGKHLCHLCYRRTHLVEVCVEGCSQCAADELPVRLSEIPAVSR